jgi:chemotaxis protein CheD
MSSPYTHNVVFIHPGEVYFGTKAKHIKTVLGSCVAILLWHPHKQLTGLCHYVMPEKHIGADESVPGRYAKGAINALLTNVKKHRTAIGEYEVSIYGGGCMFCESYRDYLDIGKKNIAVAKHLLGQLGVKPVQQKVGGKSYRTLTVNGSTGEVLLLESSIKPKQVQ